MFFFIFSGAIAGTPLDIDRELLRKGQNKNQIVTVMSTKFESPMFQLNFYSV